MLKLKQLISDSIVIDSNFDNNIIKVTDVLAKYGILLHKDIGEYQERKLRRIRIIVIIIGRIILFLNMLKFFLLVLFNDESTVVMLADPTYVITTRMNIKDLIVRLSWLMFFIATLVAIITSTWLNYLEIKYKNALFEFGLGFINKRLETKTETIVCETNRNFTRLDSLSLSISF